MLDLHRGQRIAISKSTKTLKVYTESKVRLVRIRRISKESVSDALLNQIDDFRQKHLDYDSYLENLFIEQTKEFGIPFKREVYFNISNTSYYLDFLCEEDNVAVEIDGSQHEELRAQSWDINRDKVFAFIGIKTVRFKSSEVKSPNFKTIFTRKYGKAKLDAPRLRDRDFANKVIKNYCAKDRRIEKTLDIEMSGCLTIDRMGYAHLFPCGTDKMTYSPWYGAWLSNDTDGLCIGEKVLPEYRQRNTLVPVKIRISVNEYKPVRYPPTYTENRTSVAGKEYPWRVAPFDALSWAQNTSDEDMPAEICDDDMPDNIFD